jgi:hypothetical protein
MALAAQQPLPHVRESSWPDGSPRERYAVDDDEQKHGNWEQWAENGTRTLFAVYSHGRQHGAHREWTAAGVPVCGLTFQNDLLHGPSETFHADGTTATRGSYREGARTGMWLDVAADGRRQRTSEFRDGLLHGSVRVQQAGKVVSQQKWKQGQLTLLDDLSPFPVPRAQLLAQLREILATPKVQDADDPKAMLRQEALLRLRVYRQLCGLPQQDMVLWPAWNDLCDAAAEVCHANGDISHTPPQPPGFDAARYRQGAEGARNSNLQAGGTLPESVDGYMNDSDASNIDRIGHRRWCLNPTMKKVAFGTSEQFHAMWSMDGSGRMPKGLDAVCYPPPGCVPVDLFGAEHAFSIARNRGGTPKAEALRASIRPLDADYVPGEPLELDTLHLAPDGFGTGTCIVFRAKNLLVAIGARYLVEVSIDAGKSPAHRYVVEFCEPVATDTR